MLQREEREGEREEEEEGEWFVDQLVDRIKRAKSCGMAPVVIS